MGVIDVGLSTLFGGGRNVVVETAEVFRENTEKAGMRSAAAQQAALRSFADEFARKRSSPFDRLIDGLNRLPRPALAFGTLGLFVSAMVDPVWFAARMQGIALVPEPLWWLMGAIVSFYFGARHQAKGQDFQRSIAASLAATPQVVENAKALHALQSGAGTLGQRGNPQVEMQSPNAALDEWRQG